MPGTRRSGRAQYQQGVSSSSHNVNGSRGVGGGNGKADAYHRDDDADLPKATLVTQPRHPTLPDIGTAEDSR